MSRGRLDFSSDWAAMFWQRVSRAGADECWLWTGTLNNNGRPTFHAGGRAVGRRVNASRFSYWLANGSIPDGAVICHRCDVPACVNPAHLFAGSQADNLADMTAKGRRIGVGQKGETNPSAKVSDAQASDVARRVAAGESPSDIAAEIGVHRTTIYKIVRRARRG